MQAAKKKEYLGDNMDTNESEKVIDFLNKPNIKERIDEILTEGNPSTEQAILVRRWVYRYFSTIIELIQLPSYMQVPCMLSDIH